MIDLPAPIRPLARALAVPVATTRVRPLDARLWSILAKPVSEETQDDRDYLAAIERAGLAEEAARASQEMKL